jgi:Lrp/AsnC family leucine-responsive transcriptional regulator
MEVDRKSWKILQVLQEDARISLTELAARVALSVPAVSERLKRLEESGVIAGYRAVVPPAQVGYSLMAMVGITTLQPDKARLIALLQSRPEVLECHHVTGQDSFVMKVVTEDIGHLESFLGSINHFGETRTAIVMSSPIPARALVPPGMAGDAN